LLNRTALAGQSNVQRIINGFGFTMPPVTAEGEGVPASTAAVLGQISGSPRRVHQMSGVVLASLLKQGGKPVKLPSLVKTYDYITASDASVSGAATTDIVPNKLINKGATPLIKALLEAPLCYSVNGTPMGTLKSLSTWCAARRGELRLHFAKTGTQVTADPNATVDNWITGGLQFQNGAAYSYVVLVGTGSGSHPWGTSLHAAQIAAPLAEVLLTDLSRHSKNNPEQRLLPPKPAPAPLASAAPGSDATNVKTVKTQTASDIITKSLQ
jgi:penicillin-binding protein 1A